jgi:hypothetical protein
LRTKLVGVCPETKDVLLALQLRSCLISESMGHHDSEIMDGERVG